jgi:hypothetical protein
MNTREDTLAVSPWQERPDTTGDKPPTGGLSIARCGAGSRAMQERGDEPAIRAAPDLWRQGRACNTPRQVLFSYSVDDIESAQASSMGIVTRGLSVTSALLSARRRLGRAVQQRRTRMPTRLMHVRLDYVPNTTPGTLYYECTRCGRKTKTYRKIKKHLQRCAKSSKSAC